MLKLCAFDLGNTLVNDSQLFSGAVQDISEWLMKQGAVRNAEEFRSVYEEVNWNTYLPFISHTYGEPVFFETSFRRLGITSVLPDEALRVYRQFLMNRLSLKPDLMEGLRYLRSRGLRLCIISNERTQRVTDFLSKTGLSSIFDEVVVSEAVGAEKPDPKIFQYALDLFSLKGEEAVMFGDNEIADGGCRSLGMPFVLVTEYKNHNWVWEEGSSHTPDYVMERISRESLKRFLTWKENPHDPHN